MTAYRPGTVWMRAGLLAGVTLFVGVAGHVTAGGLLPGPAWLVVLGALTIVPCAALLAAPASALRLVATVVLGQAGIHLALTVTAGHGAGVAHAHGAEAAHAPGARVGLEASPFAASAAEAAGGSDLLAHLGGHLPMMLAHIAAAVAAGLWLAVGERALLALVSLLCARAGDAILVSGTLANRLVAGLERARAGATARPRPIILEVPRPVPAGILARCVVRRGPPLLAI